MADLVGGRGVKVPAVEALGELEVVGDEREHRHHEAEEPHADWQVGQRLEDGDGARERRDLGVVDGGAGAREAQVADELVDDVDELAKRDLAVLVQIVILSIL